MPSVDDVVAKLQALKAKGPTFSELAPVQAELDTLDAARFVGGPAAAAAHPDLAKIDEAYDLLADLLDHAEETSAEVKPIVRKLAGIKKGLDRLAHAKHGHTEQEVARYQGMLDAIDSARTDGVFGGTLASPPAGQAAAADLLEACMEKAHALLETATPMSGEVATIYGALAKHHKHLEGLLALPASEVDEKEVKKVQGHLQQIDADRLASTPQGFGVHAGTVPPGQAACADLLEACFDQAHKLVERSAA